MHRFYRQMIKSTCLFCGNIQFYMYLTVSISSTDLLVAVSGAQVTDQHKTEQNGDPALSSFLQLHLKPAVHISLSISLFQRMFSSGSLPVLTSNMPQPAHFRGSLLCILSLYNERQLWRISCLSSWELARQVILAMVNIYTKFEPPTTFHS